MAWRRTVLGAISLLVLVVAANSIVRTVRSFYRLDFAVSWIATGIVVDTAPPGSTAHSAGLRPGDRIVTIDGIAVERLEDPIFVLAAGDEHLVRVNATGGKVHDLVLRPPSPDMDMLYLARTVVGAFGLACALIAVLTTTRREAATLLLLTAASLLLGAIPNRIAGTETVLRVLHRSAGAALPLLLVRFFAIFPERRHRLGAWDALSAIAVIGAAITAVVPNAAGWWPALASALRVAFGAAILGGLITLIRRWWTAERDARVHRQVEWAALGIFVGLLPYCALVLLPRWFGIPFGPFSWIAVLPIAAVPLSFLAALSEYRLWDIEPITRESVSVALVVSAGGFIFALTNHMLVNQTELLGPLRNLFAFATGVLLVVLLQPVRLRVERFLDQWLHHGRPTPRWLLTHSTRDLASATDPRELLMRLSQALRDGLEFEHVATYLRSENGGYLRVTGSGNELPERLPERVLEHSFPDVSERGLEAAGYALRLLLERPDAVHGLLYLGLRRGIFPLGTEGYEVVSAFVAQAALGLESARRLDELRRHAEELRILHANTQRIIESSAAAILVCDAAGRILSANNEAAAIFAIEGSELVGVRLDTLVRLPETWIPQLPIHALNAEAETRADRPRRLVMAVSVLELDSGSFNGRVVVLQDVTELRDLQDRMREQERLAALGRLTSGLAHEINTPLTGISSFAQMLGEMTPGDDPRAELVSKLVDQSFRVSRIVANLQEAVRGTRGETTAINLSQVARRGGREAARSLGAAERLVVDPATTRVMVWGVQGPVELAVSNLVRNALEATPPDGSVYLTVKTAEPWGEVVIDDEGPGVPEHLVAKVFEPFYTTKSTRGGSGLGLAITRDMIVQLGGEVTLGPSPRGGARATIRLKLWEESAASS